MKALILICGLPGAGKTTLTKRLERLRQAVRLCPDEWIKTVIRDETDVSERDCLRDPVEELQWQVAQKLLSLGATVMRENGLWTKNEEAKFRSQAKALGAKVELHYLEVSKEELWRRIERRISELAKDSFRISREELDSWWKFFGAPDTGELEAYDLYRWARSLKRGSIQ